MSKLFAKNISRLQKSPLIKNELIAMIICLFLGITADTNDIPEGIITNIKQLIDANGNLKKELALTNFLFLYTAIAGSAG